MDDTPITSKAPPPATDPVIGRVPGARKKDRRPSLACPECGARFHDGRAHCSFDGTRLFEGDHDALIGAQIDNYEILERIGEGGMGTVYRVRHKLLAKEYALKMLAGELAANPTVRERFLREARAAAQIDNDRIVKVVYSGATPRGQAFLVMELLRGQSLSERIFAGRLDPASCMRIARAIAEGLDQIHKAGFIHRDIKPSNIMLLPGGEGGAEERIKILDLGLVGVVDEPEHESRLTQTDHVLGTPQYMAPEALRRETAGASVDLYALGVVMYEMISGRPPFEGSTLEEIFRKHLADAPAPLPAAGGLELLIHALLEKNPEDRPSSGAEVASRIRRIEAGDSLEPTAHGEPKKARAVGPLVVALSLFVIVLSAAVIARRSGPSVETLSDEPANALPPAPIPAPPLEAPPLEAPPVQAPPSTEPAAEPPRRGRNNRPRREPEPSAVEINIESQPPGAAVMMNGGQLGLTPLSVTLPGGKRTTLTLKRAGYVARRVSLRPTSKDKRLSVKLDPE